MASKVVITGGTGLIGKRLIELLLQKGYGVAILSRKRDQMDGVEVYQWDVEKGYVEEGALTGASHIIHLAGAGVADKNWTPERKTLIVESRIKTIELIAKKIREERISLKSFVSASGSNYYGGDTGDRRNTEQMPAGSDFLSEVTVAWEAAADTIAGLGIRTVKLRTGVVLSAKGGALQKLAQPARFGFGAALGSGKQWISWIHINDLCRLYVEALENDTWEGSYNAVATNPVTNQEFTQQICEVLHRPFWLPNVPAFALRMVFGEMAGVVLGSSYVENRRIVDETDFKYLYNDSREALNDLLSK